MEILKNCAVCKTELLQDSFGLFCPNESCSFVSEYPTDANENGIIPLLYENDKLIKWILVYPKDNGTKYWHLHGNVHRDDGPAVEYSDGSKEWRLNGKLHREDGPALEWWINGEFQKR